jgi:hypothetical protein
MQMSKNVTPDIVVEYHRYMAKIFGFQILPKSSPEMVAIAALIERFAPIDATVFLKKYSTTLYNRVYIPYEIGKGGKSELYRQIRVITHEAQHVADFRENPTSMILYIAICSERAKIEARALSTAIYLDWWYKGKIPNLTNLAKKLHYYGLDATDQAMVRAHLLIHAPIARQSQVPNNLVIKKGISWLSKHCK